VLVDGLYPIVEKLPLGPVLLRVLSFDFEHKVDSTFLPRAGNGFKIAVNAGRTEAVRAGLRPDAGGQGPALDHHVDVGLG
jgi:hypothetical protein